MYAMPSIGETSDTTSRYFQTEHGSEIAILLGALNIKGGSKEPLSINFEDESGVTLTSPKCDVYFVSGKKT